MAAEDLAGIWRYLYGRLLPSGRSPPVLLLPFRNIPFMAEPGLHPGTGTAPSPLLYKLRGRGVVPHASVYLILGMGLQP